MNRNIELTGTERITILIALGYKIDIEGDTEDYTELLNKLRDED